MTSHPSACLIFAPLLMISVVSLPLPAIGQEAATANNEGKSEGRQQAKGETGGSSTKDTSKSPITHDASREVLLKKRTIQVQQVGQALYAACAPVGMGSSRQYKTLKAGALKKLITRYRNSALSALPKKPKGANKKLHKDTKQRIQNITMFLPTPEAITANEALIAAAVCETACDELMLCAMRESDAAAAAILADWGNLKRLLRNLERTIKKSYAEHKLDKLFDQMTALSSPPEGALKSLKDLSGYLTPFAGNKHNALTGAALAGDMGSQLNIILSGLAKFLVDRAKREAVGWVVDRLTKDLCAPTKYTQFKAEIRHYWLPSLCSFVQSNQATGYGAGSIMLEALVGALRSDFQRLPGTVGGLAVGFLFKREAYPNLASDNRWFLGNPENHADIDQVRQATAAAVNDIMDGADPWDRLSTAAENISLENVRKLPEGDVQLKSAAVAFLGCGLSMPYQVMQQLPGLGWLGSTQAQYEAAMSSSLVKATACWQLLGSGADVKTCKAFGDGDSSDTWASCSAVDGITGDAVEKFTTAVRMMDALNSTSKLSRHWEATAKAYKAFKDAIKTQPTVKTLVLLAGAQETKGSGPAGLANLQAAAASARVTAGILLVEESLTFAMTLTEVLLKVTNTLESFPGVYLPSEVKKAKGKLASTISTIDKNIKRTKAQGGGVLNAIAKKNFDSQLNTALAVATSTLNSTRMTAMEDMVTALKAPLDLIPRANKDSAKEIKAAVIKEVNKAITTAATQDLAGLSFLAIDLGKISQLLTKGKDDLKALAQTKKRLKAIRARLNDLPDLVILRDMQKRLEETRGGDVSAYMDLAKQMDGMAIVRKTFKGIRAQMPNIKAVLRAARLASAKEWGPAAMELTRVAQVLVTQASGNGTTSVKFFQELSRYSGLIAALFKAKDSKEVAEAFEQATDPLGGWRKKLIDGAVTVSLTAHVGFGMGAEWRNGQYGVILEDWGMAYFQAPTLMLPMGIEVTRGTGGRCFGAFFSVIDPAAFLQYDLDKDGRLPGARPLTVLAPGIGLRITPFESPFSILPMLVYRPKLRTWDSTVDGPGADVFQFLMAVTVDVTLFQLYQGDTK